MKNSIKKVFESDNWTITKLSQGNGGQLRVDAKRRFPVADQSSFFSEWCTRKYAEALSSENYGKRISDFNCYEY